MNDADLMSRRRAETRSADDIGPKLMLVALCFIWGITWPLMKIALSEVPPFSMRAASSALGALTLYLICRARGCSLHLPDRKAWLHTTIASLLNIVGFILFSTFAQLVAETSRVVILAYTMPIWAVLLAWPVLRERPTGMQTLALILCVAGIVVLVYPLAEHGVPLGMLLALGVGVSWAAGTVYLKWARIDADPMGVASWQMTLAFLVLAACLVVFEGRLHLAQAHVAPLLATAFTGIVGNGVAYALWFAVVRRLPTTTASLGVLAVPAIGVVASVLLLGDAPTATDIVGFVLIFAASTCVLFSRPAAAPAAP